MPQVHSICLNSLWQFQQRRTLMMLWPVQEKEMEKQRLLYQQSRLHNRGAAEMVLQMISACKGSFNPRVIETPFVPAKVQFQLQDWDCPSLARRRDWANGDDEPQTGYLHSQWWKHRSSAGMCSQSIKALAINQMKVTKLNIICSSPFFARKCWSTWGTRRTWASSWVSRHWCRPAG